MDESLLVINKPAGLRTLPDGYNPAEPHLRSVLEQTYGRLWIVHRLDKETSGVIVLARNAKAHRSLNAQFAQHAILKTYQALVEGAPEWETYTVRLPLRVNGDRRHRSVVDQHRGKEALTHFCLLERFGGHALLEARPETGRTHQIRAHLKALGLPIAGDELYGGRQSSFKRPMLHALSLNLSHPITGAALHLQAPYPQDFLDALDHLRTSHRTTESESTNLH